MLFNSKMSNFSATCISWREQVTLIEMVMIYPVIIVLDKQALLDYYSASLL